MRQHEWMRGQNLLTVESTYWRCARCRLKVMSQREPWTRGLDLWVSKPTGAEFNMTEARLARGDCDEQTCQAVHVR